MMRFLAALAVFFFLTGPAAAAEHLKAPPASLDPARAYLLVTLKDLGTWAPHHVLIISPYDAAAQDITGKGKSQAQGKAALRGDANGAYIDHKASIKRDGLYRTHLVAMAPGEYVIEGAMLSTRAYSTSFALGSYAFTLKPGVVTDLGLADIVQETPADYSLAGEAVKAMIIPFGGIKLHPMLATFTPDVARGAALVPGLAYEPAVLRPGATFGNYLSGNLNNIDRAPLKD